MKRLLFSSIIAITGFHVCVAKATTNLPPIYYLYSAYIHTIDGEQTVSNSDTSGYYMPGDPLAAAVEGGGAAGFASLNLSGAPTASVGGSSPLGGLFPNYYPTFAGGAENSGYYFEITSPSQQHTASIIISYSLSGVIATINSAAPASGDVESDISVYGGNSSIPILSNSKSFSGTNGGYASNNSLYLTVDTNTVYTILMHGYGNGTNVSASSTVDPYLQLSPSDSQDSIIFSQGINNSPISSAIPETATWSMMILGFWCIGLNLRFRPEFAGIL